MDRSRREVGVRRVLGGLALLLLSGIARAGEGEGPAPGPVPTAERSAALKQATERMAEATILAGKGKTAEAAAALREALDLRERFLGPDHVLVAVALERLAGLLAELRSFEEARALLERSLALRAKKAGPGA